MCGIYNYMSETLYEYICVYVHIYKYICIYIYLVLYFVSLIRLHGLLLH